MSSIFENVAVKGHRKNLVLRTLILHLLEKYQWGYKRIATNIWKNHDIDGLSYTGLLSLCKRTISRGTLEDKPRSGRKKTARSVENIEQINQRHYHQARNPGQRSTAIRLEMSLASVNRAIKTDLKIKPFRKFKSTKLTNDNVKNRMKSAKILLRKYGGSPRSKKFLWDFVINSDYSGMIGLTAVYNMKNNIVYGATRESIPRALLEAPVEKFTKGFIMWGAISSRGLIPEDGPIFIDEFLDGYQWNHKPKRTMNGNRYIDLLQERIIPAIEEVYPHRDYIFQDDCDSIHRAKHVLDFIDENMPDRIMPMDQASKLDDVWPIENIWSIIRTKLMKKDYQNLSQVKTEILNIWKSFDTNVCFRMMSSISNRLRAVIQQRGRRILKNDF
ncbi:unnamed protein product [Rotaria sp. Silwood1]|nr:unnamed protein product [Rotaria sp. Silwood1]CAF5036608.1 unnamed protein product [Rotaria sp. Silwood1]